MQGVLPGPSRFFSGGPFGKAPSRPSVGSSAEALYKASLFSGVTPQWMKDLTGHGHHMRMGSVGRADIVDGALVLNGVAGQYASTPDAVDLDVIGDIDIITRVAPDLWIPAAQMYLQAKWPAAAGQQSFIFSLEITGVLRLAISADGTASTLISSTASPVADNGAPLWLRVTRVAATGVTNFFTAPDSSSVPTVWTPLGTPVASAASGIFASTTALTVGASEVGASPFSGRIFRSILKNGIDGTTVFDADFSTLSDGTPWFLGATGKRVTVQPARSVVVDGALWTPGVVGQYATTADNSVLDLTTQLEVTSKLSFDNVVGDASGRGIVARYTGVAATTAFMFYKHTTGALRLYLSDGASITNVISDTVLAISDGANVWVKVTWRSSDGRVQFFTSPDGVVFTQLGTDRVLGAGISLPNVATELSIGGSSGGANALAGKIYRAIVKSAIDGTTVFDVDFSTWGAGDGMNGFPKDDATGKCVSVLSDTTGADTNDPKWLKYGAAADCTGKGLYLPGVSGNYASVPDAANLDIVGDITLDCEVALDDWTPSAISVLLSKSPAIGTITDGYRLILLTTGVLRLSWGDGAANHNIDSTVAVPVVDGQRLWVRGTLDVDNGAVGHDVKFFYSYDGTTWTQLGATVTTAIVTAIGANASVVEVGGVTGGTASLMTGRFFRSRIWNAYTATGANPAGGNLILDADFTIAAVAEPYASFVTTTGQTVTINRSATGRKAAVVDRPMFLFGTDDYMECADHASLDMAAADPFSTLSALRQHAAVFGANNVWLAKSAGTGAANTGYRMNGDGGANTMRFGISDGAVNPSDTQVQAGVGLASSIVGVRSVAADTLETFVDSVSGGSTNDTTTATLTNVEALRIGRFSGAGLNYADMEFIGAALWRLALSASDVARLDQEFGTNG